jgi:hypothetical protein
VWYCILRLKLAYERMVVDVVLNVGHTARGTACCA